MTPADVVEHLSASPPYDLAVEADIQDLGRTLLAAAQELEPIALAPAW
jgi:hypothetical protein